MKALILCIDMQNGFHGSFMHVLEYGEYFLDRGYEVHIASLFISEENRRIAEESGFNIHILLETPLDVEWDIVYALHLILFPALLAKGLKYKKAILMTLSPFVGIELLPPSAIWPYFDVIATLSEEIVRTYATRFGISENIFTLVPNHIPLSFIKHGGKREWSEKLEKAAVVSNHFVPEISVLPRVAPFRVDLIGKDYGNSKRATPELLCQYDAVITIGKTVQFGLGLGIPVFEYDKFGGCGYITPKNLEAEELTNFSGRGTKRSLSPRELIEELQGGYENARENAPKLRQTAHERYDIDRLVDKLLALANRHTIKRPPLKRDARLFAESCRAVVSYIFGAYALGARNAGKL